MIEDVFDFFFRHPLLCNCLKILVGGCLVAAVLGFGTAGFVTVFFCLRTVLGSVQRGSVYCHDRGRPKMSLSVRV